MSKSPTGNCKAKQGARFQFEILEPRHLFSIEPLTSSTPDAPPIETTSAAPLIGEQSNQELTNFTWLPMVFAGASKSVAVSTSLLLTGEVIVNASDNLSLTWSKLSGPGNAVFGNASAVSSSVIFDQPGTYELQLTVTNHGTTGFARLTVSVTGSTPLPEYDLWLQDMIKYGRQHGEWLLAHQDDTALDPPLARTYYDAARVFYQIADYTNDPSWNSYAEAAIKIYRDRYVLPNNGTMPGYWKFTRGLIQHYERTGDIDSKNAALLIAQRAAYNSDTTPLHDTEKAGFSREVAYAIMNYLDAERLGAPRRERLKDMVEQALGHLNQWFVQESDPQYSPFMFGLTADALMQYYDQVDQDPRIVSMLKMGASWTWENAWVETDQGFWYGEGEHTTGAPDLNLLIAPVYEWLYQKTGDSEYRSQGDQIFAGGVRGAWLDGAKQFNQNYRVSFDFVAMRLSQSALQTQIPDTTSQIRTPLPTSRLSSPNRSSAFMGDSSAPTDSVRRVFEDSVEDSPHLESTGLSALDTRTLHSDSYDQAFSAAAAQSDISFSFEWTELGDFLLRRNSGVHSYLERSS